MSQLSRVGVQGHPSNGRSLPGPSRTSTTSAVPPGQRSEGTSTSYVGLGGTHINDLEQLVQLKIFSFLPRDQLQTTRRVCRSWLHTINTQFGIKVAINNANTELLSSSPWIIDLLLINLTRPIRRDGIACARRLKSLQFTGMVVSYNLIPFLESCRHLKSLTFSEPSVDLPDFVIIRSLPETLGLKEVKKLTFESWNYTDSVNTIAKVLSTIKFGNLKELYVRAVHPPILPIATIFTPFEQIPEDTSAMIQLIMKNLPTLDTVSLGTMISQSKFTFVPNTAKPGTVVQLLEMSVQNLYMNWTQVLEAQSKLVVLDIGHCQTQQWPAIRSCITRCIGQLEKLRIQGRTFGVPWDCDILSQSRKLTDLTLLLTLSPKRFLSVLPRTLTALSLDGPIQRGEMLHLQNLVNLKSLQLNCLGLTFVIMQLQHPQNNNPDFMDLRLFLTLVRSLTGLVTLSFKDCAQESLDWSRINGWCRQSCSKFPALTFAQHDFEMHGQSVQHGFTLTFPVPFDRTLLTYPEPPVQARPVRGLFGFILSFFGLRN